VKELVQLAITSWMQTPSRWKSAARLWKCAVRNAHRNWERHTLQHPERA